MSKNSLAKVKFESATLPTEKLKQTSHEVKLGRRPKPESEKANKPINTPKISL